MYNTVIFDGGMRYLQNNVTVEHQPHPYTSAMAQLLTKTDIACNVSLMRPIGRRRLTSPSTA
jgi:hypothetical protein